jgi:hypothetical protein
MSTHAINEGVRRILRKDIKRNGVLSPEKRLILAAVLGTRGARKLEREILKPTLTP